MPSLIVLLTIGIGDAVLMLSGFSFLGIGLPAGTPEWGSLLSDAKSSFIRAPRFAVYPGLCIFFAVCACNITGEGLRRFFSPYQGSVQEHIYQTTKSVSKGVLPNEIVQESIDE